MAATEPLARLQSVLTDATSHMEPEARNLVLAQAEQLLKQDLNTVRRLQRASEEDLRSAGLSVGAAILLKKAFPAPPDAMEAGRSSSRQAGPSGRGSQTRVESMIQGLSRKVDSLESKVDSFKSTMSARLDSLQLHMRDSLLLQLEPSKAMSSTSSRNSTLRSQAGLHYAAFSKLGRVFCMMSGGAFDARAVKAAYILPRSMPLWAWGKDTDLCDSESNILFLHSNLEHHFNRMRLTVIPGANDSFKVYVLDPELRNQKAPYATGHEDESVSPGGCCDKQQLPIYFFKDLHGSELHFRNEVRPAKRLLGMHAMVALNMAKRRGWWDPLVQPLEVTAAVWSSSTCDPYLKNKFLSEQANLVGMGSSDSLDSAGNSGDLVEDSAGNPGDLVEQQGEQQDTDSLGTSASDSDT